MLNKYDSRVPLLEKGQTAPLFDEPYSATKVLRALLTPNLYVFKKTGYPTNALLVLEENQTEAFLEIMKMFGLCGVVYSPLPKPGFEHINMNYEDKSQNPRQKQNHLTENEVWNSCQNKQNSFPKYIHWYAKMYRYKSYYSANNQKDENCKNRKRFIIWSWMKFLTPLAANEDTTNVTLLLNNIWNFIDQYQLAKSSLQSILDGYVMHIMQLVGVTNLVAYNHQLHGDEAPLRNFLYFLNG